MPINCYNASIASVFALNGSNELSATQALGWCLAQSPHLFAHITEKIIGKPLPHKSAIIDVQKRDRESGITDVEILCPSQTRVIIEAKRDWALPTNGQLDKYAERLEQSDEDGKFLVSLTSADEEYARLNQPVEIRSIPLSHLSWKSVHDATTASHEETTSFTEKLWLKHLAIHIKQFVSMQNINSNMVYIVSLSQNRTREDNPFRFIDVVEQHHCYYHPVGKGWPTEPPNYIGFRYNGELKSIHRIKSYRIVKDVSEINPLWSNTGDTHFVYELDTAMHPPVPIKLGKVWPSGRVWCAIDTLLTGNFTTLSDARNETDRRNDC